jgi:hypothetical protein
MWYARNLGKIIQVVLYQQLDECRWLVMKPVITALSRLNTFVDIEMVLLLRSSMAIFANEAWNPSYSLPDTSSSSLNIVLHIPQQDKSIYIHELTPGLYYAEHATPPTCKAID